MTGSIRDYTTNFKFIIPEFNIATWHDYIEENFRSIDALFHNLFGINGFSGIWKTNSQYTAGQVLFVGEDGGSIYEGRLLKVVNDTNTGGFSTFSEAIEVHPKDYEFFTDASSAQLFSELAKDWANKTDGTVKTPEGDDTGEYSAKKYAQDSKSSATDSEHFRLLAETDKNIALEAAVSAETSAQNSETSAQNALISEQNSKTSETNSKTSEQNALISEQNAKSSEDNAKVYETNAANSVETQTNNFNDYKAQLLSTTSAGVFEITNVKLSSIVELDNTLSNALDEINSKTGVLDKTMITNCLTYIPQDINLELADGILTLKAGSKVYVPNGFEADGTTPKFDFVTIESDISLDSWGSATGQVLIGLDSSRSSYAWGNPLTAWYSGNTAPTLSGTGTTANWYDTANNIIKSTTNSGSSWDSSRGLSLPFALCTRTSGTLTSIDQIFNGFGYIGSTLFALPVVRGLAPNGRNADGSLKNIEFTIPNVVTRTFSSSDNFKYAGFAINASTYTFGRDDIYNLTYNKEENYIYDGSNVWRDNCVCGSFTLTNGVISNFNPKTTFQAVDRNDLKQVELPTGSVIAFAANSAPNGYLICNGAAVSRATYAELFTVIGTTYGSGDGSSTFNLPNLSSARMVTSATVSVKGNGKTFNLIDKNSHTASLKSSNYNIQSASYTANIGTSISGGNIDGGVALGVSTDTTKSGLTGSVSLATAISYYIKY